ncbi:MAG: efflux RND transporter periplasmic adaptor subunit [Deltaproteobacteria bacterium]|nr:efflux RND transporter periplasmic adaptor subunit [Deltaproteobacteria bacterium]
MLDTGGLAREGSSAGASPIVAVARPDRLRQRFDVPESFVAGVVPGDTVQVRFHAFPGEEGHAQVARVTGSLDPATRTMQAEVDLPNPEGRYRPGMNAVGVMADAATRLDAATRNHRLQIARFEEGAGLGLEVIDVQTELANARLGLAESVIRFNLARAELVAAVGYLSPELLERTGG